MKRKNAAHRSWLLNAALAAAVIALGAFVYFKPRSDAPASFRLSALRADEVKQIRVERKGDPPLVLERKGDSWQITAPLSTQADSLQVERLLAILDARSAHRLAATDLARFELEHPYVRVVIDGERFGFGAVNAVTREQYVLAGGAVYAVELRYGAMVPATVGQMIKKQLFTMNEAPVRFEFREFTVALKDGKWHVSPPTGELSQDDINRWVDAWRHAAALRAELSAGDKPVDAIKLEFRNGTALRLDILRREPELVLARPDEGVRYHFAAETARRLLAPPASTPGK